MSDIKRSNTPIRIRQDIFERGSEYGRAIYNSPRVAPARRIAKALALLSFEGTGCDKKAVENVRIYLSTWVIPELEKAYDQLSK